MTARITGTPAPSQAYGRAKVRQARIDQDAALGIRPQITPERAAQLAERRLWSSHRTQSADRKMAAIGFSNGPVGRKDRVLTDGVTPQVLA